MTTTSSHRDRPMEEAAVFERLSLLDRFLPVWIGAAMVAGLGLGRIFPGLDDTLDRIKVDTVSLPIAIGLLLMMYLLVALNSLFQIGAYSLLGYFYLEVFPGWLGLEQSTIHFSIGPIARAVGIFLGVPLVAGYLTRRWGEARRGREWYENRFLPRIGPVALWGLLFTVVVLFALQGDKITHNPLDVVRIELAIAVAISVFGVTSGQALAGVVGPLIEVPVLVALVYVALWARRRFFPTSQEADR